MASFETHPADQSTDGDVVTKALARVRQEIEAGRDDEALQALEQAFQESKRTSQTDALREIALLAQRLRSRTSGRLSREAAHIDYAASQNVRLLERRAALGVDGAQLRPGEIGAPIVFASWGRRFTAWVIDVFIAFWVPVFAVALLLGLGGSNFEDDTGAVVLFLSVPAVYLLGPVYFALFHALGHGQTLGKRAMGIAVRSVAGTGIGLGRAFGRAYFMFFLYLLAGVGLLIDGISPLWDRRNQAFHDKVVDTVVIRT